MADDLVQGSPEWWLVNLEKQLDKRCEAVRSCEAYYLGDHPLPEPNPGSYQAAVDAAKRAWRKLALSAVTNMMPLIANAASERLEVVGFRFGQSVGGDQAAWKLWQTAQLDADSDLVHEAALQTGQAFVLVWPDPKSPSGVSVTAEYPDQTIVAYRAGSRRQRAAAMKRWVDDDGFLLATVYLPDGVYKFRSQKKADQYGSLGPTTGNFDARWARREVAGETWPLANPFKVVPMVEFRANATLAPAPFGGGAAEFDCVVSIQDRINKTVFDRLVTAEHQAFRQRYVIGWDFPVDPETQQPNRDAMLKAAASRTWVFNNADGAPVQVGELGQADFSGFIKAVESDIQQMAMISRTPPHYLLGQMVNISGDALKASEAALVAKCRRHSRNFGESWEEVMRLALQASNDPRADDQSSMIIWGDMESRTWGETVDAVLKMQALMVPEEALWQMLPDVTPQDVQRWKTMKGAETIRQLAMQPTTSSPGAAGVPGTPTQTTPDGTGSARGPGVPAGAQPPQGR